MSALQLCLVLVLTIATTMGCVGPVNLEIRTDYPAAVLYAVGTPPVIDGRARFREIFCRLLAAEPNYTGVDGACDNFLLRLNDEPLPDAIPFPEPDLSTRYRVMVVPGFLNECFASIALPFEDAIPSLNERGVKIDQMVVSGRSSSDENAVYIAETIENLNLDKDEKLVLVGHSKGVVDILHCLVKFPPAARRVAAVVSVAGAINGSPLAANPLPGSVRYFSLASVTTRDQVNTLLRTGNELLETYSPRNNGLLLITDQLIPGGTLLGYVNADHWAIAIPVKELFSKQGPALTGRDRQLRDVLFEAMILFLAESLKTP